MCRDVWKRFHCVNWKGDSPSSEPGSDPEVPEAFNCDENVDIELHIASPCEDYIIWLTRLSKGEKNARLRDFHGPPAIDFIDIATKRLCVDCEVREKLCNELAAGTKSKVGKGGKKKGKKNDDDDEGPSQKPSAMGQSPKKQRNTAKCKD